jgi:cytochrome o ubiquinol oxidase subunit 2
VLDEASYNDLARQSVEAGKPSYRLYDPLLFQKIATQQIPPGPGPHVTTAAAQSHLGGHNAR